VLERSIVAALHSGWTRCATRAPGHLTQPPGKTAITSRGAQPGRSDWKISQPDPVGAAGRGRGGDGTWQRCRSQLGTLWN